MHKAAALGQASQLQRLIQGGASVNVVAVDSITPLHEASLRGQTQCVKLLLDAGAQVKRASTTRLKNKKQKQGCGQQKAERVNGTQLRN